MTENKYIGIKTIKMFLTTIGIILLCMMSNFSLVAGCSPGWFGTNCQFQCHCTSNCTTNGTECPSNFKCDKEWFGSACQYKDLVSLASTTINCNPSSTECSGLIDRNDTTCNSITNLLSVTIKLNAIYPFTWLRLAVNDSASFNSFQVTFKTDTSANMSCTNQLTTRIDSYRIDIRCDTMFDVSQVILEGRGLGSLCSVYINGGRNVALKQDAVQSSNFNPGSQASNAVDGGTSNIFNQGTCTHTLDGDASPNWNLTFKTPQLINIVILYNRNDCCGFRLQNFSLQSFDEYERPVYSYKDTNNAVLMMYSVIVPITSRNIPVKKINIRTSQIVTLCEMEAYGECSQGKWGLECVPCDSKCKTCHPETAACLTCNGYSNPPNCDQICVPGKWGRNCIQNCSTKCFKNSCNRLNGSCDAGCLGFNNPPSCDINCTFGMWGHNCESKCSSSCYNASCDKQTGSCDQGCSGYSNPPVCNITCTATEWGLNCDTNCSENCFGALCDAKTGLCAEGCDGYSDTPNCTKGCAFGKWGMNCNMSCGFQCSNTSCNRNSGFCDQGCNGYKNFPVCSNICDPTTWGINCTFHCNNSCWNTSCDHRNGTCDLGCAGYSNPPDCTEVCAIGDWSHNCKLSCSPHCSNSSCDGQTGECYHGCKAGFLPPNCEQGCKEGFYGINCSNICSANCSKNQCSSTIGHCMQCIDNHEGYFCEAIASSPSTPVGAIVGAIIAVIVISVIIFLGVVFWRRRQASLKSKMGQGLENKELKRSSYFAGMQFSALGNKQIDSSLTLAASMAESIYNNVTADKINDSQPIAVNDLNTFMHSHEMDYFEEQFKNIPAPKNVTTEIGMNSFNKHKNRYKNICTYDHSRVHLEINTTKNEEDYINASYIEGFKKDDKFIASQGPNKIILNDFVRMLWEQRVDKVVMLTNLIEEGTIKCEQYWPHDGSLQFGEIQVKMISIEMFADYVIRVLELSKPREAARTFTQFHFTSWPDKGVPVVPWDLVDFEQRVFSQPTSRPVVVHCSAGVGRTGTFIALHNVIREAELTGHIDFFNTVVKLRQDRILMIQTSEQYWFLHKAAQLAIVCTGTTVTLSDIVGRIKQLKEKTLTGKTKMEVEFKALCAVCKDSQQNLNYKADEITEEDVTIYQNSDEIVDKLTNRFSNIIPNQKDRPFLACETKDLNNYINAVFLPGFKKKDQQLLTQLPMPKTVIDFWRLVTQYNISLIVAFEVDDMVIDRTFGHYLPTSANEGLMCSPYLIKLKDIKKSSLWEEQKLIIEIEKRLSLLSHVSNNNGSQSVIHLKCLFTELDPDKLLSFLRQVRSYNALAQGRILYTCSNGAKYSGLTCVLSLLLDRMEHDSCLTVPVVVGTVKSIRPAVIPNLNQYMVLYDVLGRYSDNSIQHGDIRNVAQNGAVVSKAIGNSYLNEAQDTNIYANY